jgi:transposase-like protein
MMDANEPTKRNKRFLWRCHECKKQFTVRVGTVIRGIADSVEVLVLCVLACATSKKGVAALEIMRHCEISYKSALFMMSRIRFAMAPDSTMEQQS